MSILKSIMHHWNKTTNSYDTLHPETESAQITDWHSGIMASLASKTLGTVVDAITTDSVLGKLIKMLLNASGVKYLIDTNGYVCFGEFFGGLIIQWGIELSVSAAYEWTTVTFPISFSTKYVGQASGRYRNTPTPAFVQYSNSQFNISAYNSADTTGKWDVEWFAVGK